MIVTFGDAATQDLFRRRTTSRLRRFPEDIIRRALRRLVELSAATTLADLAAIPGNRLEKLSGDLQGFQLIRVNEQWRVVFRWSEGKCYDVSLTDYHD